MIRVCCRLVVCTPLAYGDGRGQVERGQHYPTTAGRSAIHYFPASVYSLVQNWVEESFPMVGGGVKTSPAIEYVFVSVSLLSSWFSSWEECPVIRS